MKAYTMRRDPHMILRDVSSRALTTVEHVRLVVDGDRTRVHSQTVNPGRISTTPADDMAL